MEQRYDDQWYNPHNPVELVLFNEGKSLDFFMCENSSLGIPRGSLCALDFERKMIYYTSSYGSTNVRFSHAVDMVTWMRQKVNVEYKDTKMNNASLEHLIALRKYAVVDYMSPLFNPLYKGSQMQVVYSIVSEALISAKELTLDPRIQNYNIRDAKLSTIFGEGCQARNRELVFPDDVTNIAQQFLNYCEGKYWQYGSVIRISD